MQVTFFCEHGQKREIGTGHLYRSMAIAENLRSLGHKVDFMEEGILMNTTDVLVIDHIYSQTKLIERAQHAGIKVVLIDGAEEDAVMADASISAFGNASAQFQGLKYMAFPVCHRTERYNVNRKVDSVFVGMGGFDANNLAEPILEILDKLELNVVVAKSINHKDFSKKFGRVKMFQEDNFYNAMHECIIGITNGGLTLFQALHYGLPCIAIPQYDRQKININGVEQYCKTIGNDLAGLEEEIKTLVSNEYQRESLSLSGQFHVDGKGISRICSIIESVSNNLSSKSHIY